MVVTSIENVLDFICDFNAVVGAHKHPVNEKVGQFGSQTFGVENRSRGFPSVVVPRLFFLLLLRLCQYCGIGIFCFQKQLVTRGLFCLVGVQVDLTHEMAFIQSAFAVLQCLDLLLIFSAFRYGSIHPKRTIWGKRRGGLHLLFQRQEYRLFQLCGVQTHLVAGAFFVCLGMAAVVIRGFLHGAGQRMTAAAAEGFAFQRVVPLLFVGLGKAELAGLHGIKHGFLYDGRVMVGDDVPRFSVLQAASGAAYFENRPLADHIHAGVAFVGQNAENDGCTPNPVTAGNIMSASISSSILVVGEALLRIGAPYSTPIQAYAEIRPQNIVQNIIHLKPAEMEQHLAQLDGQRQGKAKQ